MCHVSRVTCLVSRVMCNAGGQLVMCHVSAPPSHVSAPPPAARHGGAGEGPGADRLEPVAEQTLSVP